MTIRQRLEAEIVRCPFLLLIRHFAQCAVGGSDTVSDVDLAIGSTLAILAVPGAFTSLALMGKYSSLIQWLRGLHFNPYRVSIPDEYFFIVYSMAITGLVTLLRWDHLLPGRRDYTNGASPAKVEIYFPRERGRTESYRAHICDGRKRAFLFLVSNARNVPGRHGPRFS